MKTKKNIERKIISDLIGFSATAVDINCLHFVVLVIWWGEGRGRGLEDSAIFFHCFAQGIIGNFRLMFMFLSSNLTTLRTKW